jgi:hypothetical protein
MIRRGYYDPLPLVPDDSSPMMVTLPVAASAKNVLVPPRCGLESVCAHLGACPGVAVLMRAPTIHPPRSFRP